MVKKKNKVINRVSPYLFITPHLLIFLLFLIVPFLSTIAVSFCKWDLYSKPTFIGLKNYVDILIDKENYYYEEFWNSLFNTIKYVLFSVPVLIILPMLLALGLRQDYKGKKVHQAIFYLPTLFSVATVVLTWKWMLDRQYGLINNILKVDIPWTVEQPYVWISILLLSFWWGAGVNMVIYLSGLSSIPSSHFEAADLVGANEMQKLWYIILPGMQQPLLFTMIMTTIASFNIYGQPLMLTGGGPSESVETLIMVISGTAFGATMPNAGIASAMAVLLGIIIMTISFVQFRLNRGMNK